MLAYKSGKLISINPEDYKDELKNSKRELNAMFKTLEDVENKEIKPSKDNTKKGGN